MSDLISRTKLFNKLAYIKAPPEANEYKAAVYSLIQDMNAEEIVFHTDREFPEGLVVCSPMTAEYVAPVVRCKNCKHRDPEDKKCDCGHDILWQLPRADEWFCADGERGDTE